jgi:hypothetical protein
MSKHVSKRGRPILYKGNELKHIVAMLRKYGMKGAMEVLAEEGKKVPSKPWLNAVAKENEIELQRGRPVVYTGRSLDHIVALLKKYGLKGTEAQLKKEKKMVPSRPTLTSISKKNKIVFQRGRPRKAA